jgi:DNA-binding CsgD family transcriptional regulator
VEHVFQWNNGCSTYFSAGKRRNGRGRAREGVPLRGNLAGKVGRRCVACGLLKGGRGAERREAVMLIDVKWATLAGKSSPPQASYWAELLRWSAISADQMSAVESSLSAVWKALTSGECRVEDSFLTEERCYLILKRRTGAAGAVWQRPCARRVHILERMLLEGNQKGVGIDLGLAPSTVALLTKQCLRSLGLACTASRVPPQVVMAVHAARCAQRYPARSSELHDVDASYQVISVERPESRLASLLTPAEFLVARLLIEGKSHAEIAARRRTTLRTVANQLGTAFHRLGVSGRLGLIAQLAQN